MPLLLKLFNLTLMQAVLAQSVERWTSYPTVKGSTVPCVEYILLMLEYMFLEIIFNLEA